MFGFYGGKWQGGLFHKDLNINKEENQMVLGISEHCMNLI